VTTPRCAEPLAFPELVDYWLGELPPDREQRFEEHLLGCDHCAAQLEQLAGLAKGIRSVFRKGALRTVISARFLDAMKQKGLRLREYPVSPGGSVRCTIGSADDAVIGRLKLPDVGISRLDLVSLDEQNNVRFRLRDIPFDEASGEVLVCPSAVVLKQMPAHTDIVRLLAVDNSGERQIAEYTFIHTPSP